MRVPVQQELVVVSGELVYFQGVVRHEYRPPMPRKLQRRIYEMKTMSYHGGIKGRSFHIIVAENTEQRCFEPGKHIERLCLGNVAGMHDALDGSRVKDLDYASDIL